MPAELLPNYLPHSLHYLLDAGGGTVEVREVEMDDRVAMVALAHELLVGLAVEWGVVGSTGKLTSLILKRREFNSLPLSQQPTRHSPTSLSCGEREPNVWMLRMFLLSHSSVAEAKTECHQYPIALMSSPKFHTFTASPVSESTSCSSNHRQYWSRYDLPHRFIMDKWM